MDQTILLLVLVGATFLIGFMCGYATRAEDGAAGCVLHATPTGLDAYLAEHVELKGSAVRCR